MVELRGGMPLEGAGASSWEQHAFILSQAWRLLYLLPKWETLPAAIRATLVASAVALACAACWALLRRPRACCRGLCGGVVVVIVGAPLVYALVVLFWLDGAIQNEHDKAWAGGLNRAHLIRSCTGVEPPTLLLVLLLGVAAPLGAVYRRWRRGRVGYATVSLEQQHSDMPARTTKV